MEIIIRMEEKEKEKKRKEKENPTVGAALREMAGNALVETYLPQCVERAKDGKTWLKKYFDKTLYSEQDFQVMVEFFSRLNILVKFWTNYNFAKPLWEVTFYWN